MMRRGTANPIFTLGKLKAISALAMAGAWLVQPMGSPALAQQIVHDPGNLVQTTLTAARSLEQLRQQVEQLKAMTSRSGFGALFNSEAVRLARRYAPPDWEDAIRIAETGAFGVGRAGGAGSGEIAAILERLREIYRPLTEEELTRMGLPPASARAAASGLAAEATASAAFAGVEARIAGVEDMLEAIDGAEDIKAAADLGARISGEVALAQLELVRLQALSASLAAADANRRVAAQAEMQRFLTRERTPPPASGATNGVVDLEPR
jgi:hypothetical protein